LPADPQRLACRFEARGGIEAYCAAAAPLLSEHGQFCAVFQTAADARVQAAASAAGLELHARVDLHMRSDRADPFLTVYAWARSPAPEVERRTLSVRDANGEITAESHAIRRELGVAD
jgi:tRNA1(Val) A37 N6-methylase TrmN6